MAHPCAFHALPLIVDSPAAAPRRRQIPASVHRRSSKRRLDFCPIRVRSYGQSVYLPTMPCAARPARLPRARNSAPGSSAPRARPPVTNRARARRRPRKQRRRERRAPCAAFAGRGRRPATRPTAWRRARAHCELLTFRSSSRASCSCAAAPRAPPKPKPRARVRLPAEDTSARHVAALHAPPPDAEGSGRRPDDGGGPRRRGGVGWPRRGERRARSASAPSPRARTSSCASSRRCCAAAWTWTCGRRTSGARPTGAARPWNTRCSRSARTRAGGRAAHGPLQSETRRSSSRRCAASRGRCRPSSASCRRGASSSTTTATRRWSTAPRRTSRAFVSRASTYLPTARRASRGGMGRARRRRPRGLGDSNDLFAESRTAASASREAKSTRARPAERWPPVVRDLEDEGHVLVDGDDRRSPSCRANAGSLHYAHDVEFRRDHFPGLADLQFVGHHASIDSGPRRADSRSLSASCSSMAKSAAAHAPSSTHQAFAAVRSAFRYRRYSRRFSPGVPARRPRRWMPLRHRRTPSASTFQRPSPHRVALSQIGVLTVANRYLPWSHERVLIQNFADRHRQTPSRISHGLWCCSRRRRRASSLLSPQNWRCSRRVGRRRGRPPRRSKLSRPAGRRRPACWTLESLSLLAAVKAANVEGVIFAPSWSARMRCWPGVSRRPRGAAL